MQLPASTHAATATMAACDSRDASFESKEITCSLGLPRDGAGLRITFRFSGGHDDTQAGMTVALDDKPIECEPGSKTSLMGEDGDVSLFCRIGVGALPARPFVLKAVASWRHAQYVGYELTPD